MAKARGPARKAKADLLKPPSADPNKTRGKYWERTRPPFEAAHFAFEATVTAQRHLVGAVAEKLGIDVKEMTRVQLETFDATVKAASGPADRHSRQRRGAVMSGGQFRYPYPFTWDPTPLQQGSPTVINRGRNELGSRDIWLSSNRTQPSSASTMSSFGMDLGVPTDDSGRPFTSGPLRLTASPEFDFEGYFYTGGVFASALTSAAIQMYLEESDARGNFVRGIDGPRFQILREDPSWFSGSATFTPHRPASVDPEPPVRNRR